MATSTTSNTKVRRAALEILAAMATKCGITIGEDQARADLEFNGVSYLDNNGDENGEWGAVPQPLIDFLDACAEVKAAELTHVLSHSGPYTENVGAAGFMFEGEWYEGDAEDYTFAVDQDADERFDETLRDALRLGIEAIYALDGVQ
jgi:hypothetical protein